MSETEIVEATTDFHNGIADMVGPQPDVVFEDTTALDRADDVLNPNATVRNHTIVSFLRLS